MHVVAFAVDLDDEHPEVLIVVKHLAFISDSLVVLIAHRNYADQWLHMVKASTDDLILDNCTLMDIVIKDDQGQNVLYTLLAILRDFTL